MKFTGNTFILTSADPLCVKVYSNNQTGHCFAVGFGQFLAKEWIHVVSEESGTCNLTVCAEVVCTEQHAKQYAREEYNNMLARAPEHVQSMGKARSKTQVCIMQTHLCQLILHTCVVWRSLSQNGVKLEVFPDPGFGYVSGKWMGFNVDVSGIFPVPVHTSILALTLLIENRISRHSTLHHCI